MAVSRDGRAGSGRGGLPDVCFVLEGTYPYVSGGVSTWLHQLIRSLPDVTFTLLHLAASPASRLEQKYELPPNVVGLDHLYVQDFRPIGKPSRIERRRPNGPWRELVGFHQALGSMPDTLASPGSAGSLAASRGVIPANGDRQDGGAPWPPLTQPGAADSPDALPRAGDGTGFEALARRIGAACPGGRARDLAHSPDAWDLLRGLYQERAASASFVDFYWTWRYTHWPLFSLLEARLPAARVYHTLSTGYAGFVAALAKIRLGVPVILTEHGIYFQERRLEIAQAEWIYVEQESAHRVRRTQSFFKQWWIDLFGFLGHATYQQADAIITLYEGNQRLQIRDGAPLDRLSIIPNGIDVERYAAVRGRRIEDPGRFRVGFVGRVVPIKDVKTFIRAIKVASARIPGLEAPIIGPTDEDEEYVAECRRLVDLLGLGAIVTFVGKADVTAYYPRLDVVVLTSLSEAQPLVILEANAAGIPAVASDVGACSELLLGRGTADRALGPSGLITPVASPDATGNALVRLWAEPELRRQMAAAGAERVSHYYRQSDVYEKYREIYARYRAGSRLRVAAWPA